MDLKATGATIAKLRREAGFTQASLASHLGVSDKAVSKWERGIACPETSLWNQLSILLDTDIESLIYGHNQPDNWIGILILDSSMSMETTVFNKKLLDYLLSQFLLVGVKEITIVGDCRIPDYPGINIKKELKLNQRFTKNTFVIFGNQFLYGPDLTKHFRRAMSRNELTVIAALRAKGEYGLKVNSKKHAKLSEEYSINKYYALPYVFIPQNTEIQSFERIIDKEVCVETLARGMVHFNLDNFESVYQLSGFVKMMEENTGERIADVYEIIERRKLEG